MPLIYKCRANRKFDYNPFKNYAVFPGTEGSVYGNVKSLGLDWKPIPPSSENSIQQYQLQ